MKKVLIIVAAVLGFILAACTENEPKKETTVMSNEECLICGAPLEYLEQDTLMECVVCHKKEPSKTRCVKGHYVCSNCHTAGMDSIIALCLEETSKDPIAILEKMMSQPFCHMHGPEHHVLVGAALLTAYNNAVPADTMKIDLQAFIYKSQRYNFSIFLKKNQKYRLRYKNKCVLLHRERYKFVRWNTNNSNWTINFASGFIRRHDSQWEPITLILTR